MVDKMRMVGDVIIKADGKTTWGSKTSVYVYRVEYDLYEEIEVNTAVVVALRPEIIAAAKDWRNRVDAKGEFVIRLGPPESLGLRPALSDFAMAMEVKLKKNDHKSSWLELPIEALYRLLKIELAEFEVAMDFLTVADAQNELVDIANFSLILFDRLRLEDPKAKVQDALHTTKDKADAVFTKATGSGDHSPVVDPLSPG